MIEPSIWLCLVVLVVLVVLVGALGVALDALTYGELPHGDDPEDEG